MRKIRIFLTAWIILGISAISGQEAGTVNPGFDFSGIEKFWRIVDILEKDREPAESHWDDLFETPGYAALLRREFSRKYFQDIIRAVFMPSKASSAVSIIRAYKEAGGFLSWYTPGVIQGYRKAKKDRTWIEARVQELKTYPYLEKAAEIALRYLPENEVETYPEVDFIIFSDSRGYTPMIIGISGNDEPGAAELECLARQGLDRRAPFLLLLAHEAFHLYRNQKLEFSAPPSESPDAPVIWVLDQIENEGIGDLINCKKLYFGEGCLAHTEEGLKLHEQQAAQPAVLRIMDAVFKEMARDPRAARQLGATLRGVVPLSGHPTGFFMADVIEKQIGRQALVRVARNPFKFFELYNEAAEKNGMSPVFSDETLSYIRQLEAKYSTADLR
jgi:hypothetical protein